MSHRSITELAMRKQAQAHHERRNGERYGSALSEAFAQPLDDEAARLLKLEQAPVVGAGGEVVAPQVVGLPRSQVVALETLKEGASRTAEDASLCRTSLLMQSNLNALPMGIDAADSIQAGNSLEKMLAHQMAGAHECAMKMMNRAMRYEQTGDSVEACRCTNAAARLTSVFQDGLLTLQRLRSGGNQTVTVQHVNVAPGGQAVIGNVQTRGAKRRGANGKPG